MFSKFILFYLLMYLFGNPFLALPVLAGLYPASSERWPRRAPPTRCRRALSLSPRSQPSSLLLRSFMSGESAEKTKVDPKVKTEK